MSFEKLKKQFSRDVAANPKKAAALGLMVVVALYFWGPLIWQWLPAGRGKSKHKVDVSSLILKDDPVDVTQASKARGSSPFRWEKVRQLVRQDPLMVSASYDVAWIDPFGKPAASPAEAAPATAAPEASISPETEPELTAAGLTLGGIMIGPRTKVATINGSSCHEGDTIVVTDAADTTLKREFRISRISRREVEVECKGRTFVLELARGKLANGDDIGVGKPKASGK